MQTPANLKANGRTPKRFTRASPPEIESSAIDFQTPLASSDFAHHHLQQNCQRQRVVISDHLHWKIFQDNGVTECLEVGKSSRNDICALIGESTY